MKCCLLPFCIAVYIAAGILYEKCFSCWYDLIFKKYEGYHFCIKRCHIIKKRFFQKVWFLTGLRRTRRLLHYLKTFHWVPPKTSSSSFWFWIYLVSSISARINQQSFFLFVCSSVFIYSEDYLTFILSFLQERFSFPLSLLSMFLSFSNSISLSRLGTRRRMLISSQLCWLELPLSNPEKSFLGFFKHSYLVEGASYSSRKSNHGKDSKRKNRRENLR